MAGRRATDAGRKTRLVPCGTRPTSISDSNFSCVYVAALIMDWKKSRSSLLGIFILCFQSATSDTSNDLDVLHKESTNISNGDRLNLSGIASIFSPRMDFDQWKPLTGRGDPLRNDPTYDYEPPVLERVHYWADESQIEREKYPERKSEVLVLGISSRNPSVASRPPAQIRRHPRPPTFPPKYEDFTYKFSDHYPMTILVPPPPPPPGHKPSLYILSQENIPRHTSPPNLSIATMESITKPELITSFALQEANLIYQSSTVKENWTSDNKTTNLPNNTVSSDYAGWGPTTPFEDVNESHNVISHTDSHNFEFIKDPLSYYKPILSEAPPPVQQFSISQEITGFLPTVLPPTLLTDDEMKETKIITETTQKTTTDSPYVYSETTTERKYTQTFNSTPVSTPISNIISMLGPMISMPMVTDPDRPEDNLYAHASDNIHIFKEPFTEDSVNLEIMQTMQPPPPVKFTMSTPIPSRQQFHVDPNNLNKLLHEQSVSHTHDPYLHMRFTTPLPSTLATSQEVSSTTETQPGSTYLIIQGHSKVKTYGSKIKPINGVTNDILKPNETNEVKHLHPIKEKYNKNSSKAEKNRVSRSQNLKSLVDTGLGSIEIQETDLGIKYDVSDGSEVPVEVYRKGIVDSDENDYTSNIKHNKDFITRYKRQIKLKTVSSEENSMENIIYDFFDNLGN